MLRLIRIDYITVNGETKNTCGLKKMHLYQIFAGQNSALYLSCLSFFICVTFSGHVHERFF